MQFFTGEYNVSIDDKGRLAIPAKMRQVATSDGSEDFFVTVGTHKNLELYSYSGFIKKAGLLEPNKAIEDDDELYKNRSFFPATVQLKPDKQGRVSIPAKLCKHADVDGEAFVIGIGGRMEIWREENYREYMRDPKAFAEKLKNRDGKKGGSSSQTGSTD